MTQLSAKDLDELRSAVKSFVGTPVRLHCRPGYLGRTELLIVNQGSSVIKVFVCDAQKKWTREADAYAFLNAKSFPAVPKLLASGWLTRQLPWILLEFRPGTIMEHCSDLEPEVRTHLFTALGRLLANFHHLDAQQYARHARLTFPSRSQLMQQIVERYERYNKEELSWPFADRDLFFDADELMATLRPRVVEDSMVCARLIHGDFSQRNVLVKRDDSTWSISGLIDFEKTRIGDPLEDLSALYLKDLVDESELQRAFLAGYGDGFLCEGEAEQRFTYYLCGLVIEIASWAFERDREFYDTSKGVLARVLRERRAFWRE